MTNEELADSLLLMMVAAELAKADMTVILWAGDDGARGAQIVADKETHTVWGADARAALRRVIHEITPSLHPFEKSAADRATKFLQSHFLKSKQR